MHEAQDSIPNTKKQNNPTRSEIPSLRSSQAFSLSKSDSAPVGPTMLPKGYQETQFIAQRKLAT
jgi:hypothetical protein